MTKYFVKTTSEMITEFREATNSEAFPTNWNVIDLNNYLCCHCVYNYCKKFKSSFKLPKPIKDQQNGNLLLLLKLLH